MHAQQLPCREGAAQFVDLDFSILHGDTSNETATKHFVPVHSCWVLAQEGACKLAMAHRSFFVCHAQHESGVLHRCLGPIVGDLGEQACAVGPVTDSLAACSGPNDSSRPKECGTAGAPRSSPWSSRLSLFASYFLNSCFICAGAQQISCSENVRNSRWWSSRG